MAEVEMTTSRRLDRQEMEQRSRLLMELHEDAVRRFAQYGDNERIHDFLIETVRTARNAYIVAQEELEAYREEWERVK